MYETALGGPIIAEDANSVTRSGGCSGSAHRGIDSSGEEAYLKEVRDAALDFLAYLPTSSAFDELKAEWSACLRDAGLVEQSPFAAQMRISDESNAAWVGGEQPGAALRSERAAEEIAIAVADLDCREELDYDARHLAISHELQADYVRDHQADLDAVAAAAARVRPTAEPTS